MDRRITFPRVGWPLTRLMLRTAAGAAALMFANAASAESLRCNGEIASTGDSKISVMQKCGEPMLKDTFCKPVMAAVPWSPYPVVLPPHIAPCELVDEWMYDRGPGNLLATVRFQRGVVDSIRYEGRSR